MYLPLVILALAALLGSASPAASDTSPPSTGTDTISGGGPWGIAP